ncbi:MAG: NapC/NirT family cytochrome c [Rhodospirillales bacterium]|nr:NapC/NirT family cytochrome c [Alphaproteobacteria bacterium]MBL6947390.1 NapC/NirT family cytochrome c [Rhodospirillales bacterium]
MKITTFVGWKTVLIGIVGLVVLGVASWKGMGAYTTQSSFCGGSCHVMTEQYESWKLSKHVAQNNEKSEEAGCVDCHFLPGEEKSLKAKYRGIRHLSAYLYDPDAHLPIRPVVQDGSCLRGGCHAKTEFQDKELKFTEKSVFKHKAHFEKDMPKGQKLACDDCHIKHSAKKHFEVPKEICFTCHFNPNGMQTAEKATGQVKLTRVSFSKEPKVNFNKGTNKCTLCHTVPTKSLQSQLSADDKEKKPITHQTLEKAGVPCESCHLHQVEGTAEIKTSECLTCHNASKELFAKGKDALLMHDKHVATRRADCLNCHEPINHGAKDKKTYLDNVQADCVQCHDDQHRFQKILLTGTPVSENISPVAGLMDGVSTNCIGCHVKEKHANGQTVMAGSGEACAACHTAEHPKMLDDWQKTLEKEVRVVAEVGEEAQAALKAAEGKFDETKLKEAREMIAAGQKLLNIVQVGNGVHNKKYSIMILDEAIANFEDTIDLLSTGG